MEVITIEHPAFQQMESMFNAACEQVKELSAENFILKNRYLSAEEAAKITGYSAQTIKVHKEEIGYITLGKDLKFKLEDLNAWMLNYYIRPRRK